jgi:hypothetical protein
MTPCSLVVGNQCFRGPCSLHLQGEVKSAGKEYKKGYSPCGPIISGGRTVILAVGEQYGDVPDWAAAGRNRLGEESSPCLRSTVNHGSLLLPHCLP